VGSSGAAGLRCAPVTASPRSRPARIRGSVELMLPNTSEVWPPMVAAMPGPVPLNGTCSMRTPAIDENSAVARCTLPPLPLEA
jgi:hypothetical protein